MNQGDRIELNNEPYELEETETINGIEYGRLIDTTGNLLWIPVRVIMGIINSMTRDE